MIASGEGGRGGLEWEFGIIRCKLLRTDWINNKVLVYSKGNYIQYPVINHNGKKKKDIAGYSLGSLVGCFFCHYNLGKRAVFLAKSL